MFAAGEKIFSLMYSTGFRLTGSHQAAILLVQKALSKYDGNGGPTSAEAVKSLCRVFIIDASGYPGQPGSGTGGAFAGAGRNHPVQKALLNLEPGERTAVILRDHLGFSYAEIARVAMVSENDVAATIAAARYKLKNRLMKKAAGMNDD